MPSIITIFSHFPCCFYFRFLRVIISEHHRIKAHNFCLGFCLRFCCSLPWPGWQHNSLNPQKKNSPRKWFILNCFYKIQIFISIIVLCPKECIRLKEESLRQFNSPDLRPERPVEALASQQTNTETTFKLTPDTKKIITKCGHKVCHKLTIFVQNLNYVIEYLPNTTGRLIRENWNIIYWFIEIRRISFSEFCIFSQLFSSQ